jgi:hypothetical protein
MIEQNFLEEVEVILAGGDAARALIVGGERDAFSGWLDCGSAILSAKEQRDYLKARPDFVEVIARFTLETDGRLASESLYLLFALDFGPGAPESVVSSARAGLKSSEFKSRLFAVWLVINTRDKESYLNAVRVLRELESCGHEDRDDFLASIGNGQEELKRLIDDSTFEYLSARVQEGKPKWLGQVEGDEIIY